MRNSELLDPYNRRLNYLRISVTDRCNLNCLYCTPRKVLPKYRHHDILRYEEILRLVNIGVDMGITKVRITGGEPLVRKGVCEFLKKLNAIDALQDVSLTTNGLLLENHIDDIKAAGVKRINISLDSLKKETFQEITGKNSFESVWGGILEALKKGFSPIKINVVALRGINDGEFVDFARLTFKYPFHIRFIEYMPIGVSCMGEDHPLTASEIKQRIESIGPLIPVEKDVNDGPADRFRFEDAIGEIGFIQPLSRHFCNTCNRLRLTSTGKLRVCLLSNREVDLKTPLRNGATDQEIGGIFIEAIRMKPLDHDITPVNHRRVSGQMSAIGG